MSRDVHPYAGRLVRRILHLAPREFRQRFGDEIVWVFEEQWRDATPARRVTLSIGGALDLTAACLSQRARTIAQSLRGVETERPKGETTMHHPDESPNRVNSREALLSLIPGREPGSLAEPVGRSRRRARRQLDLYRALRDLDWESQWAIWSRSWARIASDPTVLALRLAMLLGIAATAGLGPLLLTPWVRQIDLWQWAVLVPLSPLVTLAVLGLPWTLMLRPALMRRIGHHLDLTRLEIETAEAVAG